MGPLAAYDGRPKEYIYGKQTDADGDKFVHNGVLYTGPIAPTLNSELYIDLAGPIGFDFPTPERIYGIEIYTIGSSRNNDVDYRIYTGAVKNISGTLSIVGAGFTEIVSAQDSSLWPTPTISTFGNTLQIKISNSSATDPISVAARYEIISNGLM